MRADALKIAGWTLLAATLAGAVAAGAAVAGAIEAGELLEYLPRLVSGFGITLLLSGASFLAGSVLAFLLLLLWNLVPAARGPIRLYQAFMRQTPLLAQLYLVYYGAGQISGLLEGWGLWWLFREAMACAMMVFILNTTAYQSVILIGCVDTIGKGQREAGLALGLSTWPLITRVLLPQAMPFAVRPLGNEFIGLIKASSVASLITVFDLMGEAQVIYSETYNPAYLLVAAAIYVVLAEAVRTGSDLLLRRRLPAPARSQPDGYSL